MRQRVLFVVINVAREIADATLPYDLQRCDLLFVSIEQ